MIYFLRHVETGYIKIGFTEAMNSRLTGLEMVYGEFEPLGFMEGGLSVERDLQEKFAAWRSGFKREFFYDAHQIHEFISANCMPDVPEKAEFIIRLSPEVERALRMIAGQLQAKTGLKTSTNDALRYLLEQHCPDIMIEVRTKPQTEKKQPGQGK